MRASLKTLIACQAVPIAIGIEADLESSYYEICFDKLNMTRFLEIH